MMTDSQTNLKRASEIGNTGPLAKKLRSTDLDLTASIKRTKDKLAGLRLSSLFDASLSLKTQKKKTRAILLPDAYLFEKALHSSSSMSKVLIQHNPRS